MFRIVCVYLLHNWQAYTGMQYAQNRVVFTAGERWSKVPLSLFAAKYSDFTCLWILSSSFNDAFIHTPRYFTSSKNCTHTPFRKTFDGAGCSYFYGQNRTPIVFCNKKWLCSVAESPQIFRRHCSLMILGLNTHISSANIRWFTTKFPTVHPTLAKPSWSESSSR